MTRAGTWGTQEAGREGRARSGPGCTAPRGQGLSRVHGSTAPTGVLSEGVNVCPPMARRVGGGTCGNPHPPDSPAGPQASTVPPSPKHPLEIQSPAGEQAAELMPQGAGGTGLSHGRGGVGRGNALTWGRSLDLHLTCCRFDVNISACSTLNLGEMIDQIWLHGEHSLNKVSAGVSAKKTSKLLSPDAVTISRGQAAMDARLLRLLFLSFVYPPAGRFWASTPPLCWAPRTTQHGRRSPGPGAASEKRADGKPRSPVPNPQHE